MKELTRASTHVLTISAVMTQCFAVLSIKHSKFLGMHFMQQLILASKPSISLSYNGSYSSLPSISPSPSPLLLSDSKRSHVATFQPLFLLHIDS